MGFDRVGGKERDAGYRPARVGPELTAEEQARAERDRAAMQSADREALAEYEKNPDRALSKEQRHRLQFSDSARLRGADAKAQAGESAAASSQVARGREQREQNRAQVDALAANLRAAIQSSVPALVDACRERRVAGRLSEAKQREIIGSVIGAIGAGLRGAIASSAVGDAAGTICGLAAERGGESIEGLGKQLDALADRLAQVLSSKAGGVAQPVFSRLPAAADLAASIEAAGHSALRSEAPAASGGDQAAPVPSAVANQFGQSFEGVRLHTGKDADARARSLDTKAVTEGKNVYFRDGAYNPESHHGREILGHELAHVVQQRGSGSGAAPQGFGVAVGERGTVLEHEAARAGEVFAAGGRPEVHLRAGAPVAQRFESREHAEIGDEVKTAVGASANAGNPVSDPERKRLGKDQFEDGKRSLSLNLRLRNPATGLPTPSDRENVPVSYGEMIALSGDLYFSVDNLLKAPAQEVIALRNLIAQERKDPKIDLDSAYEAATAWRREGVYQPGTGDKEGTKGQYWGVQPGDSAHDDASTYVDLATGNDAHFSAATGAAVTANGPEGNAATNNHQGFLSDHSRAIAIAQRVRDLKKLAGLIAGAPSAAASKQPLGGDVESLQNQAYVYNAGGDHYLTDAFSAGHLINKSLLSPITDRVLNAGMFDQMVESLLPFAMSEPAALGLSPNVLGTGGGGLLGGIGGFLIGGPIGALIGGGLGAYGGHKGIKALVRKKLREGLSTFKANPALKYNVGAKLVHDYLNASGVIIVSRNGRFKYTTKGDGHMDGVTQDIASRAVLASRNYIRALMNDSDADLAKPESADDAWDYTPNVDVTAFTAQMEPILRKELQDTGHLWDLLKTAVKVQDTRKKQDDTEKKTEKAAENDQGGDWGQAPSNHRFTQRMIMTHDQPQP